jgi:SAM-dependent methyltransferase
MRSELQTSAATDAIPAPPSELAAYVGDRYADDPVLSYLNAGAAIRSHIELLLPDGYRLDGRRVLDFGCGSGRVLRHFVTEAREKVAEFHGCDIHGPSVEWLREYLVPPLHVELVDEEPPLPYPDSTFDVVWSTSVFTHLTDHWAGWLVELHRVMKPDGILIVTILSEAYNDILTEARWDEDRIGMTVLGYGAPWHAGGPMVLHSPWWIRAHWGRAFEILRLETGGFVTPDPGQGQGVVVMRKRDVEPSVAGLEALEPDEPREIAALQHNLEQALWERADLNRKHDRWVAAHGELKERYDELKASHDRYEVAYRELQRLRRALHRRVLRRGASAVRGLRDGRSR